MTRYTEKRATNKGRLFYQLAVEFYLAHPSDFYQLAVYQLAVEFYLAHPSEPHPSEASRLLWHMYKWVTAGHYEEPDDSADDYLKAFFARELESAYNWTHGGKEPHDTFEYSKAASPDDIQPYGEIEAVKTLVDFAGRLLDGEAIEPLGRPDREKLENAIAILEEVYGI